jgi:hypothetical protein
MGEQAPFELAERVATAARALGVETALIGATALAVYGYVRGTDDIDLASAATPEDLLRLRAALEQDGMHAHLSLPDEDDTLGGVVRVWTTEEDGDPVDPVEIVNFYNPLRPIRLPASTFIRDAVALDEMPALRYVRLPHLIMLKLYAGSLQDRADVVAVLKRNPGADLDEIRALCTQYDLDGFDELAAEAKR